MALDAIRVIARREYRVRVKTWSFWIATLAVPLFLAVVTLVPTLLIAGSATEHRLVVVDETGELAAALASELGEMPGLVAGSPPFAARVEPASGDPAAQRAELDRRTMEGEIDAWLWISAADLDRDRVEYHAESISNFATQALLETAVSDAARRYRLRVAGLDPERVDELARPVELMTVRITEEGGREEGAVSGVVLAYVLLFLLCTSLVIYGQQVMTGVLEEKSSRIVELIVSTVRPVELMLGKISGICLVALTQLALWLAAIAVFTLPGVVAGLAWLPAGIEIPGLSPSLLVHFLLLFLLGFVLYATFYASIGAAFNNLAEAQQFASLGVILLVAPVFLFLAVLNDPDSPLSVATSLVPVFTPMLMMLRLAVKTPPLWQIALGYLLTAAFAGLMVAAAARIYRTGILMHGKKPSPGEIWRWIRYP